MDKQVLRRNAAGTPTVKGRKAVAFAWQHSSPLEAPGFREPKAAWAHVSCKTAAAGASQAAAACIGARGARAQPLIALATAPVFSVRNVVCQATDYAAAAGDEGVLRMPSRTELAGHEVHRVFGYARNLHERYHVGKVIGAGSFGVVRECMSTTDGSGRRFAVKTVPKVPKRGPPTPRYLLKLRTEVEIMQQLGYSLDAVCLYDVFEDDQNIHLVMELCAGGALLERIEAQKWSERYIARVTKSILRFISQCHAKGIIYRDVKPDNFLFLNDDDESPLKATDFGLSIRHWPDEVKLTSRSGTPAYMAPELVMQSYDEKADIWSVGMLTYQLLTGRFPFWEDVRTQSLSDVWKAILGMDVDWTAYELQTLSPRAVAFLKQLLQRDPNLRPSASAALDHPWLSEGSDGTELPLKGSVVQRLQRFSTYGRLKQMVLKLIVDEIQEERALAQQRNWNNAVGGLQDLFTALDTDSSGGISLEELTVGLRKQGYVLSDSEIETLVRKIDANHDGDIVLSEFMTTLVDWKQLEKDTSWQKYLDLAFETMDINGDGYISLDEILEHLPEGAESNSSGSKDTRPERVAEAKLMLREADTNGDGQISREEFYNLLKDSHAPDSLSFYDDRLGPFEDLPTPASISAR